MTNQIPMEILETQAASQRKQLHNDVAELRFTLKERLDTRKLAREFLRPAAGAAALVGLVLGYGFTGMFTRN